MKCKEDRKEVFSKLEKKVAISILNGMSLSNCSTIFGINKVKCNAILNTFCMKSNRVLYDKLRQSPFEPVAIGKLRKHSQVFIHDSKNLEEVTIESPIWALPDVPIMALNALWSNKNYTIKDVLNNGQRDLLRFRCFGRVGLEKLLISLNKNGFSISK